MTETPDVNQTIAKVRLNDQVHIVRSILNSYPSGADQAVVDLRAIGVEQDLLDAAMMAHRGYIADLAAAVWDRLSREDGPPGDS